MKTDKNKTEIPTFYIEGKGIADAFYKALKTVHERGIDIRTEYDRKNSDGSYIDPPSKDARVMIRIENLFAEPRFPKVSYCELGKYIAEFLGAKDHLVVPTDELLKMIKDGREDLSPTRWPYCYHQRLTAYPMQDGSTINQLEKELERLSKEPVTRRAVVITGFPAIDLFIKTDMPCLRELQFRTREDEQGRLILNTFARWRSRDGYKAQPDNLVGLRNQLQFEVVPILQKMTGKEIIIGPYSEEIGSLHIYGQDYLEKGMNKFFDVNPTLPKFLRDSYEKQEVFEELIIDQLKELKEEKTWNFPKKSIELINYLIEVFESGEFKP